MKTFTNQPGRQMCVFTALLMFAIALAASSARAADTAEPSPQAATSPYITIATGARIVNSDEEKQPAEQGPTPAKIGPLKVTGDIEILSNSYSSSGNQYGFLSQNGLLYYNDKLTQRVRLDINGMMENNVSVTGQFIDLPYMDRQFGVTATGQKFKLDLGDTLGKFESGAMTGFTKTIRGMNLAYTEGKTSVGVLFSNPKSKTQKDSFNGQNVRGPYPLNSNGILENSESVRINGQLIPRSDYIIDYYLGQITFSQTLDPSDLVEINYEAVLWFSQKTGNLLGMSMKRDGLLGGKASMGASFISEENTGTSDSKILASTKSMTKAQIAAGGYVMTLDQAKIEKDHELVIAGATSTLYLSRSTDYAINYPAGIVTFSTSSTQFRDLLDTATITVVFNYYPKGFLQYVQDEPLNGEGQIEYMLQYRQVYGGTEQADLYQNNTLVRRLNPGTDYVINDGKNTILFIDPSVTPSMSFGRSVRISYEIVPRTDLLATDTKQQRTVKSVFGQAKLWGADMTGEIAESSSDIRLKTVQVLDELVATVADPTRRNYLLQHEATYESLEVYFDDKAIPNAQQRSGTDFVVELDPATNHTRLNFKHDIPAGTTIIASYKYQPTATNLTDKNGRAFRFTAAHNTNGLIMNGEYMRKGAFFAPLTEYNDLETQRLKLSAGYFKLSGTSIDTDFSMNEYDTNLPSFDSVKYNQLKTKISHKFGSKTDAAYTLENSKRADSLSTKTIDNSLTGHRLELNHRLSASTLTNVTLEKRSFTDNTALTSDRDTNRAMFGIDYNPGTKLTLKLKTGRSRLESKPPAALAALAGYTIDTYSTTLDSAYAPTRNLGINISLDTQRIRNSSAGHSNGRLDNIRADLVGKSESRFIESYTVSLYRQDIPDLIFGDTRSNTLSLRTVHHATQNWLLTPTFTKSSSRVGSGSISQDNTLGMRAEFRPYGKLGLRSSLAYATSNRNTTNISPDSMVASTFNTDQNQYTFGLDYVPNENLTFSNIFEVSNNTSGSIAQNRSGNTFRVGYLARRNSRFGFQYNIQKDPGAGSRNTYELEAIRKINNNLDFGLNYKNQKQAGTPASDYSGQIFTLKLEIKL